MTSVRKKIKLRFSFDSLLYIPYIHDTLYTTGVIQYKLGGNDDLVNYIEDFLDCIDGKLACYNHTVTQYTVKPNR